MGLSFFHGSRVTQDPNGPLLIQTAQSAIGAFILADPGIDATVFTPGRPILIKGPADYTKAKALGKASLKHIDAVFDQIGTYVYVVNAGVTGTQTEAQKLSVLIGSQASRTGLYGLLRCEGQFGRAFKPRLVSVPGHTSSLATDGIVSLHATHQGGAYTTAPTVTIGDGTGAQAVAVLTDDKVTGFIVTRPWFGYDPANPPAVTLTGGGGAGATAECSVGTTANPICSLLPGVLEKLRAVAFVDGPDTTDEDALAWRSTMQSDRLYPCDPRVLVWDTDLGVAIPQPLSSRLIGIQAKADYEEGFHRSVSNKVINGIEGVTRPVSYGEEANLLNYNGIGTVISSDNGGWVTWGNRTASDPTQLNVFLSVRRTTDFINEAVEAAFRSFNDAPMTIRNARRLLSAGNDYMRTLKNAQAIYDGQVYFDPTKNTDTQLGSGQINLAMRYLVPPPMEDIETVQSYEISYFSVLRDGLLASSALAVSSSPLTSY